MERIVVVGASLAGLRGAETIRQEGYAGRLMIIGAETSLPYNRPPLSKQILLGRQSPQELFFPEAGRLNAEWMLGRSAKSLDALHRIIQLDDGSSIAFDKLLIATGVSPRIPSIEGIALAGVHVLRTLPEALLLKSELVAGRRLVVVGAGFVGCEVAATARQLGLDVVIVNAGESPLSRVLSLRFGRVIADLHKENGVSLLNGRRVVAIEGQNRVDKLCLDNGDELKADVVVFGVGSIPAVDWLTGSGLQIDNGVVCDPYCLALGGEGKIAAAGDVAAWPNVGLNNLLMRVEHWSNAVEQGTAAARALVYGRQRPYAPLLSLWSDQFERRLQVLGAPALANREEIVQGDLESRKFVAECWFDERLVGAIGMNMPAKMAGYRKRLELDLSVLSDGFQFEALVGSAR